MLLAARRGHDGAGYTSRGRARRKDQPGACVPPSSPGGGWGGDSYCSGSNPSSPFPSPLPLPFPLSPLPFPGSSPPSSSGVSSSGAVSCGVIGVAGADSSASPPLSAFMYVPQISAGNVPPSTLAP